MDIRQIETFLWISRLGSIAEACKRLNATQSTLSMRLKKLEDELRIPLFDRSHKRLTPTAKGRDLARLAESILELVEQVRFYVADPKAAFGTIRVGAAELVALTWAPDLIRDLNGRYPNVSLDLEVGLTRPLMEALKDGRLDVVLAPTLAPPELPFAGIPLGSVAFSWVASPSLGLGRKVVTPKDLSRFAIIGASDQSIFHGLVHRWFADHGTPLHRLNICNSLTASISMASAGVGVSLLPRAYCDPFIKGGQLQVLRADRRFEFEFYAIHAAQRQQTLPKLVAEAARCASTFGRARRS